MKVPPRPWNFESTFAEVEALVRVIHRQLASFDSVRDGPLSEISIDRRPYQTGPPGDKSCKRASISEEMLNDITFQPEFV